MKKILHVVHIHTSPKHVFAALTTEKGLSSWWSTRVETGSKVGDDVRFTFHGDFHPVMRITALVANERLEWKCVDGHEPWQDNAFAFRLKEADGGTQLTFVQDYARELSDEAYGIYNYNWGYYLESLKGYCETGRGKPFEAS